MKLRGKEIKGPNVITIVVPRDPEPLVLYAQAILDYDLFDKLCPRPTPPIRMYKGGEKKADMKDARFMLNLDTYAKRRTAWLILESLRLGTPELEFTEKIDFGDPATWENWLEEFQEAGFSGGEINLIIDGCMAANALNDEKLEEARNSFLLSMVEGVLVESSSQPDEPQSTPPGEPAND